MTKILTPSVVAHTQFEDPFGNGIPITSPFVGSRISLPLSDDEGRTAWYHGYYNPVVNRLNMSWAYNPIPVAHTSLHVMSRAFELNIPGSSGFDKDAFVYYASNAVFNVSGNVSHALWFYPVAHAEAGEFLVSYNGDILMLQTGLHFVSHLVIAGSTYL